MTRSEASPRDRLFSTSHIRTPPGDPSYYETRRGFLHRTSRGLGSVAAASLLNPELFASSSTSPVLQRSHFSPRAQRVIYLFMAGGPSHVDLFDPKPHLTAMHGQPLPPSVRNQQRLTLMTRNQESHLCLRSPRPFAKHGACGMEISELLPHTAALADELCLVRSMFTEPINHDPAVTFMQTGGQEAGRPSMGSWLTYGLGSAAKDLPEFIVLLSGRTIQPLLSRYWHSGFLPARHQGVQFRSQGDPVLFLSNPAGVGPQVRRDIVEAIGDLNRAKLERVPDPEIQARIDSFELAYRMQSSVPELMDITTEPRSMHELYGVDDNPGSFARNCLLARRLAERGVRFIQLYHAGWDQHQNLKRDLERQCRQTDQACAALLRDLKNRGMLDDTLVVWGGEFGRTSYSQGALGDSSGRDHHAGCFSVWLAGGGIRGGTSYGATDDFGYNVAERPVHTHDLQATILHIMGIDHERLVYRYKGRDFRLTDIGGRVLHELLV